MPAGIAHFLNELYMRKKICILLRQKQLLFCNVRIPSPEVLHHYIAAYEIHASVVTENKY